MKTKFVETPGQSQAEVDELFKASIEKRAAKLAEKEKEARAESRARIAEGRSKQPKLSAAVERQERTQSIDRSTGLRF